MLNREGAGNKQIVDFATSLSILPIDRLNERKDNRFISFCFLSLFIVIGLLRFGSEWAGAQVPVNQWVFEAGNVTGTTVTDQTVSLNGTIKGAVENFAPSVGPFVQFTGSPKAVVRWKTSTPMPSVVEYSGAAQQVNG